MKVYIAKSYLADHWLFTNLIRFLDDYNITTGWFRGGKYNEQTELSSVDTMLVIPPKLIQLKSDIFCIRKGLYKQIKFCLSRDLPVFIVSSALTFHKILIIDTYDIEDWKRYYGKIKIDLYNSSLIDYLPIKMGDILFVDEK